MIAPPEPEGVPYPDDEVREHWFHDDGTIVPNNPNWGVLHYRSGLAGPALVSAQACIARFAYHGWENAWTGQGYGFHHYRANTHEVFGILQGSVAMYFGGPNGEILTLVRGDAVIIPAGVARKRLDATANFLATGAFPDGRSPDLNFCTPGEWETTHRLVGTIPRPKCDPLFGPHGPLLRKWPPRPGVGY